MKTIKLIYWGFILSLSSIFTACNSEFPETVKQSEDITIHIDSLNKLPITRTIWYDPKDMEWWNTHNGTGGTPSEHNTNYNNRPVCQWTLDTCQHYVTIQSSYDMGKYTKMQIQYRFLPQHLEIHDDLIPESDWHFLGEEYAQEVYPNGIVNLECRLVPEVEINAHAFPKGRIGIRYRVLRYDFPGRLDWDRYNTDVVSGWVYTHGLDNKSNDYGYEIHKNSLTIHISIPKDSPVVSYSAMASIEGGDTKYLSNSNLIVLEKVYEKGTYSVIAHESSPSLDGFREAYTFGHYDENVKEVFVNFGINDFREAVH